MINIVAAIVHPGGRNDLGRSQEESVHLAELQNRQEESWDSVIKT